MNQQDFIDNESEEQEIVPVVDIESESLDFSEEEVLERIQKEKFEDFERVRQNNLELYTLAAECAKQSLLAAAETHDSNEYRNAMLSIEKANQISSKLIEHHLTLEEINSKKFKSLQPNSNQTITNNTMNLYGTAADILRSIEQYQTPEESVKEDA